MSEGRARDALTLQNDLGDDKHTKTVKVSTPKCGVISVHVQGDISTINPRKPIYLTVHDVGSSYLDFVNFANHSCMAHVRKKSIFLHIELPGQAPDAADLPDNYKFPSVDDLALEMMNILHYFKVPYCVGLGEGAGANILTRFTMKCPELVLGSILIHCNPTEANLLELFNYRVIYWNQTNKKNAPPLEHFLVFHKFGKVFSKLLEQSGLSQVMSVDPGTSKSAMGNNAMEYVEKVGQKVNPKNSSLYIDSYLARSDISHLLMKNLKTDVLLVTSNNPTHADTTQDMLRKMDPAKAALLKLDDIDDIISETPEKLAYALVLFCQGLGLLSSLPITSLTSLLK